MVPELTRAEIEARLAPLLDEHPGGALVFDADGTLWPHDVGNTVFQEACLSDALHADGRLALLEEARRFRLACSAEASLAEIGQALFEAYLAGIYPEREAAEMQVWIYAGHTEDDVRSLARRALAKHGHHDRVHREVLALAHWARERGAMTAVVSASPRWVVEEAVRELGFPAEWVRGGLPNEQDGRVRRGMREPLPYGPTKVDAGRSLLGERAWLASFGDSSFDLDMLGVARLAVGIGEKSALTTGLLAMPHAVRLSVP